MADSRADSKADKEDENAASPGLKTYKIERKSRIAATDKGGKQIYETTKDQMVADYQKRKDRWLMDVEHTPCARDSLIYGIIGGLTVGLLCFLKTSAVTRSCDFAIGGFLIGGFGSWRYCRHKMTSQYNILQKSVLEVNRKKKEALEKKKAEQSTEPPQTQSTGTT